MAVNMGSAVAFLELDTSKFTRGFQSALNDLKVFGSKSATVEQKVKGLSSAFKTVGSQLTASVTLPLVGVGAASLKVATDFESGMAEVKAISGATGKDFEALTNKAKEMGAKTKFSATEASSAFKYMAMAGWDTNDMLNSISGVMNLAAASGEDLASVSDIVTDAMTAFGLSADGTSKVMKDGYEKEVSNATRFTDVLAKASSSSNTNVALMGETFKYVAPVAGALGYSVEDTATAIGLMANSGIKGSQAGTALRSTLSRLAKPTKQVQKVMDEYNISLVDSQGQVKPLKQLMEELRGTFGNLTEAEQASVAASLAGQEGMSGLMAIVNSSDEDFNNLSDAIYNANGACDEMSETMLNTTKGSLELLKSALEGVGIAIGERLQPYIRKLAEWLQGVAEWFTNLSDRQLDFIVKVGLVIATLGPLLLVLGQFASALSSIIGLIKTMTGLMEFFKTFEMLKQTLGLFKTLQITASSMFEVVKNGFMALLSPVGAVIAVVGILVAAFITLWKTNEDFRNKIKETWNELKEIFGGFIDDIKERFSELQPYFEKIAEGIKIIWGKLCDVLAPAFETTFQTIVDTIKAVLDAIIGIIDVFIGIFTGDFEQAAQGVREIYDALWGFISDIFGNIMDFVAGALEALGFEEAASKVEQFKDTVQKGMEQVKNAIASIPGLIKKAVQKIVDVFKEITKFFNETIPETIAHAIQSVIDFVKNGIDTIITFFTETLPNGIQTAIETVIGFISNGVQTIISFFTETIPNALNNFVTVIIPNVISQIGTFLSELPYKLGFLIGELVGKIVQFGQDVLNRIKTDVPIIIESVITFFKELPGKIWDWLMQTSEKIAQFVIDVKEKAIEVGTQFVENVITFFKELPSKVWDWLTQTIQKIGQFVINVRQKAIEAGTKFVESVITFFKELPSKVWSKLVEVVTKVVEWRNKMVAKAIEIGKSFVSSVVNFIKELPSKIWSIIQKIPETVKKIAVKMKQAGRNIIDALWSGIKEIASKVLGWVESFVGKIKDFFQGIIDGFNSVKNKGNEAREISKSVNGSHANGLDYVPFNGYVAELHKGERVLTAEENKIYNEGKMGNGGDTFNFYNTKPNPYEYARQMKQAKKELLYGF